MCPLKSCLNALVAAGCVASAAAQPAEPQPATPLAIEAMLRSGEAEAGDTALLIAFGAGLSYAGQVVTLPPIA